MIPVW